MSGFKLFNDRFDNNHKSQRIVTNFLDANSLDINSLDVHNINSKNICINASDQIKITSSNTIVRANSSLLLSSSGIVCINSSNILLKTNCVMMNTIGIIPFVTDTDSEYLNVSGIVTATAYSTTISALNPNVVGILADGDYKGRLKKINQVQQFGTTATVFANLEGGTNIGFFPDTIAWCTLLWNGSKWRAIELVNAGVF